MERKNQHRWGKHLPKVGKEILIKSVVKAIPSYFMSVSFLLPSTLQDDLQKIMNSFWWGSNKNTDKDINWLSWDLLSIRKENEGMGFQHLYAFNLAMLWKLVSYSNAIISKVFKAKYYPKGEFLGSSVEHNSNYTLHGIHTSMATVKEGIRWKLRDGTNIKVRNEPWLQSLDNSCWHSCYWGSGGSHSKFFDWSF